MTWSGHATARAAPAGIDSPVLVANDTAFPACARWIEQVPPHVRVEALLTTSRADGGRCPFPGGE